MKLFSDSLPFRRACLHCHTTCSDGRLGPKEAAALYQKAGYDILAITDHRKVTLTESDALLILPGIEIDYSLPGQCAHILGLGMDTEGIRAWNPDGTPQEGIDLIRDTGGAAILAHPAWSLNTPQFMRSLRNLSGVEIWNSVSTLPLNGDRADSSSLLDVTWASGGRLLPVLATDDTHRYEAEFAVASTMIQCPDLSRTSVLDALLHGRFYATTGPELVQVELAENRTVRVTCSEAAHVIFYSDSPWAEGRVVSGPHLTHAEYALQPNDHFLRVEVRDTSGRKAWSSPFPVGKNLF